MKTFYFNNKKHTSKVFELSLIEEYNLSHVVEIVPAKISFFDEKISIPEKNVHLTGKTNGKILFVTKNETEQTYFALFFTSECLTEIDINDFDLTEANLTFFDIENTIEAIAILEQSAGEPRINKLLFESFYKTEIKRLTRNE